MIKALPKYVFFNFSVGLVCFSLSWFFQESDHNILWPMYGLLCGLLVEVINFILHQKKQKARFLFYPSLLLLVGLIGFFSIFKRELIGFASGILVFPILSILVIQNRNKKMLTWDDLKKNREEEL